MHRFIGRAGRIGKAGALLHPALGALLLATLALSSCKGNSTQATTTSSEPEKGKVVARVGDIEVTESELNSKVSGQIEELERQLFEARMRGLSRIVEEKLLDAEAKRRGQEPSVLMRDEVQKRVPEPTEVEIEERLSKPPFSLQLQATGTDEEKERRKSALREQARVMIRREREMKARAEFAALLRKSVKVEYLIETPSYKRVEVKSEGAPSKGPGDAPVTLVSFTDFQCPSCRVASQTVKALLESYPESLRYVYRSFPLAQHPQARRMAEAAYCALDQKKFWEMHDLLYASQGSVDDNALKESGKKVGLDEKAFVECLSSGKHAKRIEEDMAEGQRVGVGATPTFFLNGIKVQGAKALDSFKILVDSELMGKGKG